MNKSILTAPLKSWKDENGDTVYRLGDLPVGIKFSKTKGGQANEVISYPRSAHTGKRQCKDLSTGKIFYEFCTKKVYIISEEFEK